MSQEDPSLSAPPFPPKRSMGIFGAAFVGGLAITALRRMPWWWAAASAGAALAWRNAAQKRLRDQGTFADPEEVSPVHQPVEPQTPLDTDLVQRWSPSYFSAPTRGEAEIDPAPLQSEAPSPTIEPAPLASNDLPTAEPPSTPVPPQPASPWVLTVEPLPAWADPEPTPTSTTTSSSLLARAPEGVEERETAPMESTTTRSETATAYLPPISTGADLPDEILISAEPPQPNDSTDFLPEIPAEAAPVAPPEIPVEAAPLALITPAAVPESITETKPTIRPASVTPQKVLVRVPARVTPKAVEPASEPALAGPSSGSVAPPPIPPAPVVIPRQNPVRKKSWLGWWK